MSIRFSAGMVMFLLVFSASLSSAGVPEEGCQERAEKYSEAYALHMHNNELEKMAEVLAEWAGECGENEPVFRAKALYAIMTGTFPGNIKQEDMLAQAIAFEIRYTISESQNAASREEYFSVYRDYFGHVSVNGSFDRRSLQKARELLPGSDENNLAYAFLTLYSGNPRAFFLMLKEGRYTSSPLSVQYFDRVTSLKRKPEFNFGISTGLWIPSGDLQILGTKPSIGVFAGVTRLNTSLNALFELRFGRAASPVTINIRDSLVQTDLHHGSFLGLEANHVIFKTSKTRLGMFVIAGYNTIDLVEEALLVPERLTFGSWTISGGPFIDRVFSNRTRLGIHPGYMILNHRQTTGSSLRGDAIIVKLVFGYSENAHKYVNLRRLGY
jgi:hypothetical protein